MSLPKIQHDSQLVMKRKRIHIPQSVFSGIMGITTGTDASVNTGVAVRQEVSTFGTAGLLMADAGDFVNHLMMLPYDLDPRHPMYVRVVYTTGSATTADTIDWIVTYLSVILHDTTLADGTTALDTVIAADTVTGAYDLQATTWGIIDGATFAHNAEYIHWRVEMDAFAAGLTEDKLFLGLDVEYTPWILAGPNGPMNESRRPAYLLSSAKE